MFSLNGILFSGLYRFPLRVAILSCMFALFETFPVQPGSSRLFMAWGTLAVFSVSVCFSCFSDFLRQGRDLCRSLAPEREGGGHHGHVGDRFGW
ncbi:MAG: hypothetical protein ABIK28_01380 [Planctomycetota bacterium]